MTKIINTQSVREVLHALPPQKSVAFTGHRPEKLHGYDPTAQGNRAMLWRLRHTIEAMIIDGARVFISGMALGIDMWAARIVLALKNKYPDVQLHAYIPCANHTKMWRQSSKDEWQSIIDQADSVVYVSKEEYTPHCMNNRNRAMIRDADVMIAVWDGTNGGTGNCVRDARKVNRPIIQLHPHQNSITLEK